jgi:copper chaperone CopZ
MSLFKKNTITFTLSVQGMKCPNCAKRVKDAIEKTRGASAEIDLAAASAVVTAPEKTDPAAVAAAVTEIGFPASVQA